MSQEYSIVFYSINIHSQALGRKQILENKLSFCKGVTLKNKSRKVFFLLSASAFVEESIHTREKIIINAFQIM